MDNKGFTLIEMLVGISIGIILMTSVGVLVSGGIKNITSQQKNLKNSDDFGVFENKINSIFSRIDTSFEPKTTGSGIILKIRNNFDEGGFIYIGSTGSTIDSGDGIYCGSGSEDINTNHVFIKSFIPDFDIDIQKSHEIDGIGKGFFGYNEIAKEGVEENKVYLNNPTGTGRINGNLVFSDTLNNRVLYKSGSQVYELLNENDGLDEPTGLYYDNLNNTLYISNSGSGEVLAFSSKDISNPTLTVDGLSFNSNRVEIDFFNQAGEFGINNNLSLSDFTFNSGVQTGITDTIVEIGNKIIYSFSGGTINNNITEIRFEDNSSNFTGTGTYYVKLNNIIYPFFSQSDNDLLTLDDNKLEIHSSGLNYPTNIDSLLSVTEYGNSSFSNMNYNKDYDYILKTPIKSFNVDYNANKLLNVELVYYKKYNCYNLDEKIERTFLIKKNFR